MMNQPVIDVNKDKVQRNIYLYASAVTFVLVTTIIFSLSAKNWAEQRALLDLYYFPVLISAISLGWRWGIFYSVSATLLTLIIYFVIPQTQGEFPNFLNQGFITRTIFLNLLGSIGGLLSDSDRKQKVLYKTISIELQKINTKLEQRVLELTMLYDTAQQLSTSLNLDKILSCVIKSLLSTFKADSGYIYLLNPKNNTYEILCHEGTIDFYPHDIITTNRLSIIDYVEKTKQGIILPNIKTSSDLPLNSEILVNAGIQSLVVFPLLVENRIIGILTIYTGLKGNVLDDRFNDMLTTMSSHTALAIDNAFTYQRVNQAYVEIIGNMVNSIETKDLASIHHCQRTMTLATDLSNQLNIPIEDITAIRYILLIDHLGQVSTDKILSTMGNNYLENVHSQLNPTEPEIQVISGSIRLLERVVPIVKTRHEWYDGSGQPDGLKGNQIPLPSQIVSLMDMYHNLVFGKGSFQRYTVQEAIIHIQNLSGKQFNPDMVDAFIRLINSQPA